MATNAIAAMLDELMGRNRNLSAEAAAKRPPKWTDADVCPYYLVDFCPHDVFINTKADLGPCERAHDEAMKQAYERESDKDKVEKAMDSFLRFTNRLLTDLQQRIRRARERLVLTQNEDLLPATAPREACEKLRELNEEMASLVSKAEACGNEGDIEEAQRLLKVSEELREEREELRRVHIPNYSKDDLQQQKAMEVCDTCGSFLIVNDAPQRIDDHLTGKLHMGYARIREGIERVTEKRRLLRSQRDKDRDRRRSRERGSRERSSRDRSTRDPCSRDRSSRDRSNRDVSGRDCSSKDTRSRDHISKDRSSRDHGRKDPGTRDHSGRDASRNDYGKNGKDRERERSRSRDHRRRSRSRERRRSDYDKERRRRRSRSRNERRK